MFYHYSTAHIANIVCHIVAGSLAILAGLVALVARKRGRLHARAGQTFVFTYALVILTALIGVVVFEFRSFLTVAIIASSYSLFSGYRATRLRGRRPALVDCVASILGLTAPVLFVLAMHALKQPWNPVLTWTVLRSLIILSGYDLLRFVWPARWLARTWVHEHIYKIVGAFDALTATFAATVFPQFQPWSALLPVIVGTGVIVSFFIAGPRAWGMQPQRSRARRLDSAPAGGRELPHR